jgi:hypothetical protein
MGNLDLADPGPRPGRALDPKRPDEDHSACRSFSVGNTLLTLAGPVLVALVP